MYDFCPKISPAKDLAALNASSDVEGAELPQWTPCKYRILFEREGSKWLISNMVLLEENPPEEVKPTPDMSLIQETPQP